MSFRRMLPFLLLNIVVSASVVLLVLTFWDRRNNPPEEAVAAVALATSAANQLAALPTPALADAAAAVEETAAEDAPASDEPVVHVVKAGETLNVISQQYGVSVEDIATVNQLDNINILSVGQQLTIPVNGIPEPTEPADAASAQPTAANPTPIPTEPAATGGQATIQIAAVSGAGSLEEESIQIVNTGGSAQTMQGWRLVDEDGNVYTFGQVSIFGEGAGVTIHSRTGENTATGLYWGLSEPAWRPGEQATLFDAANQVIAKYTVP